MKKIFIRKILKYDPTIGGKYSRYQGYRLIGLQKIPVNITAASELEIGSRMFEKVFSSTLKRARDTALTVTNKNKVEFIEELNEIKFDLEKLLTKEEYEKFGSSLVRERFCEAFVGDDLIEKRIDIEKRIKSLSEKLKLLSDGNYLLISHSFYMKVLEIYLMDKKLFDKPYILKKYFDTSKKTFDFGKGFEIDVE